MDRRLYGERIVAPITAATFVLLVGIVFPFSSAAAEPIDLNGSIPLGAGSISGALHGDLTKNILTLNRPFISKISIDTAASGPLPPGILPESFTYTQNYSVDSPFGDSMSYNVEFIITPHLTASLIVPTWHFDIRGNANLKTGTARLAAAPQPPSAIGTINAISKPTFRGRIATTLDPVAAALAQAALDATLAELNSSGAKLNLHLKGNWEKLSIGSATMALAKTLLIAFILQSFSRDNDGHIIKTMESEDGNSRFYKAEGVYYLWNTCNTWTAKGLKSTGWNISPAFKITPGSVMANLDKHNTSPAMRSCETGLTSPELVSHFHSLSQKSHGQRLTFQQRH